MNTDSNNENIMQTQSQKKYMVYCHFSFRRNRNEPEYGYFTALFTSDIEAKRVACRITKKQKLWKDQQFVTAVQSYEFALKCISDIQGQMMAANVNQVMLVTGNGALANWIENPKKNRKYRIYMERAVEQYKSGARREIAVGIGLCEAVDIEKSYKYCTGKYLTEQYTEQKVIKKSNGNAIDISKYADSCKTGYDLAKEIEDNMTIEIVAD